MTIEKLLNILEPYKHKKQPYKRPDAWRTKPNVFSNIVANLDEINGLYKNVKSAGLGTIIRTESGSIKRCVHNTCGVFDVQIVKNSRNNVLRGIILTIIIRDNIWVFKFGHLQMSDTSRMCGMGAFNTFKALMAEQGLDLSKYECDNGLAVKDTIESPIIKNLLWNKEIKHVHHLDLNRAWPSSTCDNYPELEPVYAKLEKEIIDPLNGYFQSKYCDYKYSLLAKAGVEGCNKKIKDLCKKMTDQGFIVLGINTDGIWYKDFTDQNRVYHDEDEGIGLHKWKTDHKDCTWFATSNGQYYFIEDGVFNVKARGYYAYESIKPRGQWTEEDYFKAITTEIDIIWDDEEGFILYGKTQ